MVCYGNELMGNDSFGKAVFKELSDEHCAVLVHQLLPELSESLLDFDTIVFVDASHGYGFVELYEISPNGCFSVNPHHLTPEQFISLLQYLYGKKQNTYVCTAYFDIFEHGNLCKDFGSKVRKAVELIKNKLVGI